MANDKKSDHFTITCHGNIVVVSLRNTETTPSFNFAAMEEVVEAMKQTVTNTGLAISGWHVLYDLRDLNEFDIAVWPFMAKFVRWTRSNGRLRNAHILPSRRSAEQMKLLKQVMQGLFEAYGSKDDELRTCKTPEEAMEWLAVGSNASEGAIGEPPAKA